MEVPSAGKVVIVSDLGVEVRGHVRRAGVVGCVKLHAQGCIEGKGKYDFSCSDKLLRVLDFCRPYPMVVKVVSRTEGGRARVVITYADVGILVISERQVRRIRQDAHAVGRLQAPRLSSQRCGRTLATPLVWPGVGPRPPSLDYWHSAKRWPGVLRPLRLNLVEVQMLAFAAFQSAVAAGQSAVVGQPWPHARP